MNRTEFLEQLERLLWDIPESERKEALEYYQEGRHEGGEYCTMCGPNFCAMNLSRDLSAMNNE